MGYDSASLMLELNNPIKKLCPKLEKNVNINPNIIILKLNFKHLKYNMTCKVSFIGLGVMGYPMAGYISKAGHNVTVYNRTTAKADKWITEYKGSKADTPAKAAEGADFIFTCVGNDNDLKEVLLEKMEFLKQLKKVLSILITLLLLQLLLEKFINLKQNGFGFLDAPVSGGQAGAENGAINCYGWWR